jgi:hypothetical protein
MVAGHHEIVFMCSTEATLVKQLNEPVTRDAMNHAPVIKGSDIHIVMGVEVMSLRMFSIRGKATESGLYCCASHFIAKFIALSDQNALQPSEHSDRPID